MTTIETGVATGVVVLGMHRSGTSAIARAINLLGVPLCAPDDLWLASHGNPTGYWESATLAGFNERLLRELGSAWWCPPPVGAIEPLLDSGQRRAEGARAFGAHHTTDRWLWKDPRISLTLPFWRAALEAKLTCVLVLRNPLEVAASLKARDRIPVVWALALWERYSRHALHALHDHHVLVTDFGALLSDPLDWSSRASSFLAESVMPPPDAGQQLTTFLQRELRHTVFDDADLLEAPEVSEEQRELHALMQRVSGTSGRFMTPELPPETPLTDELLLTLRREFDLARLPEPQTVEALLHRMSPHHSHTGGAMGPTETLPAAVSDTFSLEWRRWIAENLLLGIGRDEIVEALSAAGLAADAAGGAIDSVLADPCWQAGDQVAQRLRKLESLLDIVQDLDQLDGAAGRLERMGYLSRRDFLERYYARNRPVILEGLAAGWAALTAWTPEHFKQRLGHIEVEVQSEREADELYELHSDDHKRLMTFGEYIDRITELGAGNDLYLTANNHFFERPDTATLLSDIDVPREYLDPETPPGTVFFWFGSAGTITPLHHDVVNVLFVQVRGRKRITLIPSLQAPRVYNGVGVYSEVDALRPDLERYPRFTRTTRLEVILEPGESLFIPVGWWHTVQALDTSVSLSFTGFVFPNDFTWEHPQHAF